MSRPLSIGRFVIAWATVALFLAFGGAWLSDLSSIVKAVVFLVYIVLIFSPSASAAG